MFRRSIQTFLFIALLDLAAIQAHADDAAATSFDAKGVKIHYTVQGKGEPVILLHGLFASGQMNWGMPGVTAALATDHQVIAIDFPGHGASDAPRGEEAYGLQMVEDVVLLMDHLNVKKAHIVGYSMGGMVTVKLMVTHPDRVISGLVGGWGWMKKGSPQEAMWAKMGSKDVGQTPPACMHAFGQFAVTEEELKAIKLPVMVLIGDSDPIKHFYVEPLQTVRSDWPTVLVKGAGHITCIFKPQFKEEIVKWVGAQTGK
jgi:pimeloyl-ACP methyl ester carboxylesterase